MESRGRRRARSIRSLHQGLATVNSPHPRPLWSVGHTGAINEYEKTGNLRTVQTVMGHASLAVTLGYLRGLEVCVLNADEMPELRVREGH